MVGVRISPAGFTFKDRISNDWEEKFGGDFFR